MIKTIVILVIVIAINIAMIFAIVRLVKRTGDNMKKFFLDKTAELYPKHEKNVVEEKIADIEPTINEVQQFVVNEVQGAEYKNETFRNDYKNIKEEMQFDRTDVILNVIDNADDEDDEFISSINSIND